MRSFLVATDFSSPAEPAVARKRRLPSSSAAGVPPPAPVAFAAALAPPGARVEPPSAMSWPARSRSHFLRSSSASRRFSSSSFLWVAASGKGGAAKAVGGATGGGGTCGSAGGGGGGGTVILPRSRLGLSAGNAGPGYCWVLNSSLSAAVISLASLCCHEYSSHPTKASATKRNPDDHRIAERIR